MRSDRHLNLNDVEEVLSGKLIALSMPDCGQLLMQPLGEFPFARIEFGGVWTLDVAQDQAKSLRIAFLGP